jgi:hypothetical protein
VTLGGRVAEVTEVVADPAAEDQAIAQRDGEARQQVVAVLRAIVVREVVTEEPERDEREDVYLMAWR